jgi:hypothetical protein
VEVEDLGLVGAWTDFACVDRGRGRDVLDVIGWSVGSENGELRLGGRLRGRGLLRLNIRVLFFVCHG